MRMRCVNKTRLTAFTVAILTVLLSITGIHAQDRTRTFSEATGEKAAADKIYDFEMWRFSIGSFSYEIDKTGMARRRDLRGGSAIFELDLAGSDNLARVYYAQYEGDLLLLCEDETWDAGSGFISRFDGRTLRQKWRAQIPGFNVANGLIEGNSAYLGAIGFAAKLDLDSGEFIWKHQNFYRKYRENGAFNVFYTPKIVGREVVYTENRFGKRPNIIRFNKNNGKVVKVELN